MAWHGVAGLSGWWGIRLFEDFKAFELCPVPRHGVAGLSSWEAMRLFNAF